MSFSGVLSNLHRLRLPGFADIPAFWEVLRRDWHGSSVSATREEQLSAALDWLVAAWTATGRQGISAGFSLLYGWGAAYPETTGYLIPTLYDAASLTGRPDLAGMATSLAEWEIKHQHPSGGIRGYPAGQGDPVAFDTGQVLFGLLDVYRATGRNELLESADRAGRFLLCSQDENGAFSSNVYMRTPHAYDVRISWALLLLSAATGEARYREAAERNLDWTLQLRLGNDLFAQNGFLAGQPVITHLLAYTLEGLLECGALLGREDAVQTVHRVLAKLLELIERHGRPAGSYREDWSGDYTWSCLAGECQLAIVFRKACRTASESSRYLQSSGQLLEAVRRTQILTTGHSGIRGGIKGSDPIWGPYEKYTILNWATKFFVDALLLDMHGRGGGRG